ncbi:YbhB/YbcL family Raf kinase inhibitor-like protein [Schinkia azotoformans]|uniref:S-layer domain-containing protein n=1 Tax=Schinkia azotoformans LMG 9581 TaxID=1131731 RepID=K6D7X8_SCHAZ|nr:YbhB/YbcL family Raf kinase inhibitor-like protein [Schinkia azotoformans]EKN68622.1 S-layer domain-containing protein [Schinkia azotoformans LMG 9581]MEC1637645.1 YbhB/YbcL family Raf kinase inhibitor-like protein [Schinkia azotoformans]MEC1718778.1 YbhB/YbcL family Raf kinase inhibitor-like protein [Schinkia azotoformans]MEC1944050.1 YbhB/YbcL family Raf kinase inhibitor-like protein [Schinkia azotoformans]MED4413010.1 YbhB/YbcL family Raf kinase inhibitor-like protein [Schinkia azotoform
MGNRRRFQRFLPVVMVLAMILSFFGTNVFSSGSDIKGHWAEEEISEWVEKGLIGGYKDGSFKPDASISRAEFIALVNRAFEFTESSETGFNDVSTKDWYYSEVLKAKAAGYIGGYQDGTIKPKNNINRQEVAAILSRLLKVENAADSVEQFKDKGSIPQWSKGVVGGIVAQGLMKGFNDGTFKPLNNTTRAEAVVILSRALNGVGQTVSEKVYDTAGTYGPAAGLETVKGNVVVTAPDITLKNMIIEGNLTIAKEVGNGEVYLKGVTVKGKTYVNGGGENSIYFEDTVLLTVIVNKADGTVRIVATGSTTVQEVTLQSNAKVEQVGTEGVAFQAITLAETLPANSKVTLIGNFETVDIQATTVAVEIPRGSIQNLNVDKKAKDTTINLAKDAKIISLVLEAAVKVLGDGTIDKASGSKANESSYKNKPINMTRNTGGGGGGGSSSGNGGSTGSGDTTPPTIISLSPENGAKNVSLLRDWVITFDEDVTAVEEKFITIKPVDEDIVVTAASEDTENSEGKIDIPVLSDYVIVSGKVVTIKLWNYLMEHVYVDEDEYETFSSETEFEMMTESDDPYSSKVYVTIQKGAFKDKAGNEFAGINDKSTWSFSVSYDPLTPIEITTAFENEGNIDEKYSMDGGNVSLPVEWTKVEDAQSYIILLTDLDTDHFVHWIVKDIPKNINSIGEGVSRTDEMVGVELKNSYPPFYAPNDKGYGGPQPNIKHEYLLEVFALNVEKFDLAEDASPEDSLDAIGAAMHEGKVIGYGEISGTFGPEVDGTKSIISSTMSDTISIDTEFTFDVKVVDTKGKPIRGLVYSDEIGQYDFDFKLEEYVYLDVISVVESDETPGLYTVIATHGAEEEIEITGYVLGIPITSGNLSFKVIGNPPSVNKIVLTSKDNIIDIDGTDDLVIEFSKELSDESKHAILQYLTEQGIGIEAENKWDTWYSKQLWIKNTVESDAQFTIPKNLVYDGSGNSPAEDIVIKIPNKTLSLNGISISSFTDTNPTAGLISGIIEFTKAEDESIVTDYTIYISDRDTEGKWIKDLAKYNVKANNNPNYSVTIDNLDVSDATTIRIEVQPNSGEIYNWHKFSEITDNSIGGDEGEPDITAPKATSITVDETGLKILIVFDEPIVLHDSLSKDMFTVKVDKDEEFYIIPVIDYKETENQNELELTLEEPIKVGFDVNIGFNGEGSLSDTTTPPNFVETTLGLGYVTNNSNVGVLTDQN